MTWDSVPWFVGGGAQHSPEIARLLAHAATAGSEGVLGPYDLKVNALAVPGGAVRVAPGGCVVLNRAAGGTSQSYVGRNTTEDQITIASTGSGGGRSDLIVARVEDPFMAGEPWQDPADPTSGPYIFTRVIPNVSPTTTTVTELNLGYSAIPLARVDVPASTGTIQASHIVDLRQLANPRRERHLVRHQPSTTYEIPADAWSHWPTFEPQFRVPVWATHVVATMQAYSVQKSGGHFLGDLRLEWCIPGNAGPEMGYAVIEEEDNSGVNSRTSFAVTGEYEVTNDRGLLRSIRVGARKLSAYSAANGHLKAFPSSNFVIDVEFFERVG